MKTKWNVITLSLIASLTITGCSRAMKSISANPSQTQSKSVDLDPNTQTGNLDEEPTVTTPTDMTETEPEVSTEPTKEPKPVVTPPVVVTPPIKPTTPTSPVVTQPLIKPAVKPPTAPVVVVKPVTPSPAPAPSLFSFLPLLWEKTVIAARGWTKIIYGVIKKEETYLLGQNVADDVEIFCPNYRNLNEEQRLNFWGQFFASLAYHESGWNPVSRMVETTFTKSDSVTKKPVVSEGLLQLSYQDENNHRLDCGFDWDKDKNLNEKDPEKTILNPYNNLRCGIKIMSIQLKKYRSITLPSNVYWAVLKTDGKYSKISQISRLTRSLKICQK